MIITKYIDIRIVPKNYSYWKSRYSVTKNTIHSVSVSDLPKGSNLRVSCVCDSCGLEYIQRFSRNTETCGKCRRSSASKGNKHGSLRNILKSPSKEDLANLISKGFGKTEIASNYNTTIGVVSRWLKENDLKIQPYQGRRYFRNKQDELNAIESIRKELESNNTHISGISKATGLPRNIIRMLQKNHAITTTSKFDVWKTDYDYIQANLDIYIKENNTKSLKEISETHGISIEQLKRCFTENNVPVKLHSHNKSKGELEVKQFISSIGFECHSTLLDKTYEIDCFVPIKNFGVEYCGEYWHRHIPSKKNGKYHQNKFTFCSDNNISLMTIFSSEWANKRIILESMIKSRLGLNIRIPARKCVIMELKGHVGKDFHESNHISGGINSSINIGLYHDSRLVSVLSFVQSRFDKDYQYEISRFSSILGHTVVGGLSKMFAYFVDNYNPVNCMTYSDLRFGEGKCYEKIGFIFDGITPPNYYYMSKNGNKLESRQKYQKSKLVNMPGYDISKTEFEIMDSNGYLRVYDCGNHKYIWKGQTDDIISDYVSGLTILECSKKYKRHSRTIRKLLVRNNIHIRSIAESKGLSYVSRKFNLPMESLEKLNDRDWLENEHNNKHKTLSAIASGLRVKPKYVSSAFVKHDMNVNNFWDNPKWYTENTGISEEIFNLLNDRDWLKQQNHDLKKSLREISRELGMKTESTVSYYFKKHDLEVFRFAGSLFEKNISKYIQSIYDGVILENDRNIISPKEIDIWLPEKNIGIELNGCYWHSNVVNTNSNHLLEKTVLCRSRGIRLVQIFDLEYINKEKQIETFLKSLLTERIGTVTIKEIDGVDAESFHMENNLFGTGATLHYGVYGPDLVSVVSFIETTKGNWMISRHTGNVGFTGVLDLFKSEHKPRSVLAHSDTRFFTGNTYLENGFKQLYSIKPSCYTFEYGNKNNMTLSEDDIGTVVYDCGQMVFGWFP